MGKKNLRDYRQDVLVEHVCRIMVSNGGRGRLENVKKSTSCAHRYADVG